MKPTVAALLLATCFSTALAQDRKPGVGSTEPLLDLGRKDGRFVVYVRTSGNIEAELAWNRLKRLKPAPLDLSMCAGSSVGSLYGVPCSAESAPDPAAVAGVLKAAGVKRVVLDANGPLTVKDGALAFTLSACSKTYVVKNRGRREGEKTDPPDLAGSLAKEIGTGSRTAWVRGELQGGTLLLESVD